MKYPIRILIFLLVLVRPAAAADGDLVQVVGQAGEFIVVEYFLCDGATGGATKTCSNLDVTALTPFPSITKSLDVPEEITFALRAAEGCAGAVSVKLIGLSDTAALVPHTVHFGLTEDGVSSFTPMLGPRHAIYKAEITVGTNCTDVEVIVYTSHRNSQR